MMSREALRALLSPTSIAVVGADPTHPIRGNILRNLEAFDFPGRLFGISKRPIEGQSVPYFNSLDALPGVPELVIAAVSSRRVNAVAEECVRLGVKAMIVCDGGFADADGSGAAAQAVLARTAEDAGIALLGPNCYGIANFVDRNPMYLIPLERDYRAGTFAAIAASGSVLDAMAANSRGVRWSHLIGTGNEAVLDASHFIDYLTAEPRCAGFVVFMETIRRPTQFFEACKRALQAGKPVIVLRAGRSEGSRASALAHSGALCPPVRLLDAKLRSCGVMVIDSFEEMLASVILFQTGRTPKDSTVAFVSPSGGLIELAQDVVEDLDLVFPDFGSATKDALKPFVGSDTRRQNPLDWWPSASFDDLPRILDVVMDDPNSGTIVMLTQFGSSPMTGVGFGGFGVRESFALASRGTKLLVVLDPLDAPRSWVEEGAVSNAAVLGGFGPSLRALDVVLKYHTGISSEPVRDPPLVPFAMVPKGEALSGAPALNLVGLVVPRVLTTIIRSAHELTAALDSMNFPVVLKSGDEGDIHKTERHAVRLNLDSLGAAKVAAEELFNLGCSSLVLQPQIKGTEVLIGVHRDPQLGHFIVVGLGGVWTEIFDDVAIRPLGIGPREAQKMLRQLKSFPLLNGARGHSKVDLNALVEAICGIDALGRALQSEVESIDVNPVIATATGVLAVDAVVVPTRVV